MSQHQDAIYANDRIDLILPYGKIDEEFYQQIIAPYEPTVINDQFVAVSYTHLDVYKRQA